MGWQIAWKKTTPDQQHHHKDGGVGVFSMVLQAVIPLLHVLKYIVAGLGKLRMWWLNFLLPFMKISKVLC
jgi:hypothetical protein